MPQDPATTQRRRRRVRPRREHSVATRQGVLALFFVSFGVTYMSLSKLGGLFPKEIHFNYDIPQDLPRKLESVLNAQHQSWSEYATEELIGRLGREASEKWEAIEADAEETYNSWSSYLENNSASSLLQRHAPQWSESSENYFQYDTDSSSHLEQNIWERNNSTTTLPSWMQEYMTWHRQTRKELTKDNWKEQKYLIMTCFHGRQCGGITDRLRPILAFIRMAHQTKRLLLIHWERPFPLEEFLLPPAGGLDWRVPNFLKPEVTMDIMRPAAHLQRILNSGGDRTIFTTQYQSWNYGWHWYDEELADGEQTAMEVFREVWNTLFVPTPPIQALIDQSKDQLGLVPGEFATAHIRALWTIDTRTQQETTVMVQNALNCASHLRPGGPFLVTSEHLPSLREAQKYGKEKGVQVITPSYDKHPLHVGLHNESDTSIKPEDFYSAFIDIYLIAMSRCVAVGPGGYGYWAQILGYDNKCWKRHSGERGEWCNWRDKAGNTDKGQTTTDGTCVKNDIRLPCVPNATVQETRLVYNPRENIWDNSTLIPDWMKQYFQWHKETRAQLTPENYHNHRFMVMTCFRGTKCGGMTDRLRPILTQLRVAYASSRLFFIYWERPFPLEEYLLPPEGGFDWRLPPFLVDGVKDTQFTGALNMRFFAHTEPMFVSVQYQSWHYGELVYDEALIPGEPDANTVFRDVWNTVFTPSPPVAEMVYHSFETMGINPGQYTTVHIRALYNLNDRGPKEMFVMVRNAMNCASNLQPGGPFFVTADSEMATAIALSYGKSKNVTVVVTPHNKQPLHLGLHNESDTSIVAADFYDVFSDMYLIAETKCMVVGPGGYGRWGILLGHNRTCNTFSSGFKAETCEWVDSSDSKRMNLVPQEQTIPRYRQPMSIS